MLVTACDVSEQKILTKKAEFFCGATLARWAQAGHEITYCLLTCGDKGSSDPNISTDELCQRRHKEQVPDHQIEIGSKSRALQDETKKFLRRQPLFFQARFKTNQENWLKKSSPTG